MPPEALFYAAMAAAALSAASAAWLVLSARPSGEVLVAGGRREAGEAGALMGIALRLARALAPLHRGAAETPSGRELEKKLIKAGRPFGMTVAEFLCLRYVGAAAGALVGWMLSTQATATGEVDFTYVVPLAIFGSLYPQLRLNAGIRRRQLRIFRDLPYVLDLLTLSTEAGQDFSSAMAMVVDKGPPGPLVDEFRIAHQEVTLGKTRTEALRAMASRIDVPELTSFVLALIQAGELGSSVGRVLRIMAEQMRVKRSSLAEEAAGKVPVKLMAPLILLIFPASFIVLFVPLYLRSQLSGGF